MCGEEQVGNVEQDIQLLMISIYVVIVLKRVSILRDPFAQAPSRSRHRLQPEALVLIYSCLCLIYSYNVPLHQCRISTPSRYAGYPLRLSLLYSFTVNHYIPTNRYQVLNEAVQSCVERPLSAVPPVVQRPHYLDFLSLDLMIPSLLFCFIERG